MSFVPLRNYTTLKHIMCRRSAFLSFVPLRNYTTLKLMRSHLSANSVLYLYEITLLSNISTDGQLDAKVLYLYEITLLSN